MFLHRSSFTFYDSIKLTKMDNDRALPAAQPARAFYVGRSKAMPRKPKVPCRHPGCSELVIDPEQAETVKRIYREYLEGKSAKTIAKGLMRDGVRNGAGHTKWWDTNIFQILTNEKYKGDALLQKTYTEDVLSKKRVANDGTVPQYYVEDSHDAIITKEMFHEVQAEMARRSHSEDGQHRREGFCGKYALTGVLVCGECGAPYRRQTWTRKGSTQIVWRCRSRLSKNGTRCGSPTIPEETIQHAVVQAIREAYGEQKPVERAIENIRSVVEGPEVLQSLESRLQKLQEELVQRVNEHRDYGRDSGIMRMNTTGCFFQ